MENKSLFFEEKQYHGLNRHSIVRRLLLAVFCFVAYYWSQNPKPVNLELFRLGEYPGRDNSGQLFFILGLAILFLSTVLLFVLHMKTTVKEGALFIDGILSARKVRIDLEGIASVKKIHLRPSFFNRPVYNLHSKGRVRFYTYGNEAIEMTTRDGLIYRIGTQRPAELYRIIEAYICK